MSKDTTIISVTKRVLSTIPKKRGDKQRKETLEKYQNAFLQVPRINDRKPVFISSDVRTLKGLALIGLVVRFWRATSFLFFLLFMKDDLTVLLITPDSPCQHDNGIA